ncbi:MAG: redoxin domain-containing protein [Candidatus Spechtbacterales bacterium]
MNKRQSFPVLVLIVVLAFLAISCGGTEVIPEEEEAGPVVGLDVGDIAPDITFTDIEGNEHRLSDFRGQVVFLNFWATWCPPCVYEMPSMEEMHKDYKDEGFVIIAVSVKENEELVKEFMEEHELTFTAYLDKPGTSYDEFNKSGGIPQSYVIDRDGIVRQFIPGARDWATLENRSVILRLLRGED